MVVAAAAVALLAAACVPPPPRPNADYQMYAQQNSAPAPCAETPGVGFNLSPTTGELGNDAYTIVMLFRLSEMGSYDRLIDFKSATSDNGVYLSNGALRFHRTEVVTGSKVIANNEYAQVVVTRAASGTMRGLVDGVQQWQFTDTTGDGLITNNAVRFFIDNTSGGLTTEHSAGAVARIRVFDRPLPRTEIDNLGQTPGSPCT